MASEIEEIPEINDSHHNDNTDKNDSNSNRDGDSNGDSTGHSNECENNGRNQYNNYTPIGENKKKDRSGATSKRGVLLAVRSAISMITTIRGKNISKEEDKKDNIRSEHRGNNRESDAHLPDNLSQDQPQQSSFFKGFCTKFKDLGPTQKKCLLSFIFVPENTELKKTLLVNWWLVEGFLDHRTEEGKTVEDIATGILNYLTENSFILPAYKHCRRIAHSFEMHSEVHSAVITLAKEDYKTKTSRSDDDTLSWYEEWASSMDSKSPELDNDRQETVETLTNGNRGSLDYCIVEPFSKKRRNVKVLPLGMWRSTAVNLHFEVVGTQFFKGLKNMENLRFLSLQGISGIQELPSSITHLQNLEILDAKSCYHLHKLPKEIGLLKKLTHLDISECYLLDYMPKELSSLSELQVFKGFVDSNSMDRCTLGDLENLKKLRKLSVTVSIDTFPTEKFLDVYNFKQLLKLKIIWGGKHSRDMRNKNSEQGSKEGKFKGLNFYKKRSPKAQQSGVEEVIWEKLELQCLPHITLPKWVNPYKLTRLKKLYIRGGELRHLQPRSPEGSQNVNWKVEALRLRYLRRFKMDWRELQALFRELQYLEMHNCPKLTLFPCDCYGVWSKPTTESAPLP